MKALILSWLLIGGVALADFASEERYWLAEMKKEVPAEIPSVFISSLTNQGITELKDLIWQTLHS